MGELLENKVDGLKHFREFIRQRIDEYELQNNTKASEAVVQISKTE